MELTGEVENIIYKNESNGYTIASMIIDNEELVVTGYLPFINKGDSLKIVGKFVVHPDYGEQFKVDTFEKVLPQTEEALEKYLGNGIIKGVGPATAKKIIKKFGKATIEVMKMEPERLAEIRGITKSKAEEIAESFVENWELWQIVSFLEKFGIGSESAQKIYKALGADTINKIESDPYVLEEIGLRVDFAQIDKMALSIGIEKNSLRRIDSGIIHALNLATYNGHTCVLEPNLITYVVQLLGVSDEDVLDGLKDLKAKEKIYTEEREEIATIDGKTQMCLQTWVYLDTFYKAEVNIARKIKGLQDAQNINRIPNIDKMIKKVSEITPSEKQKEAIKMINENNVSIITGGPGTGKTTIIKTIIDLYKSIGKKTVLCAPTGRAAKRMTEATGEEAKTLHRLLEIRRLEEEKPNPDMSVAPIDANVIIIDEMSMVDIFLINYVMNAVYKGTKLVMVGDVDQLQSVGPGSVLKDFIKSNTIPYIALNKIFRQAAKSKIIVNSHKVNEGINFIEDDSNFDEEELDDFEFISEMNIKNVQQLILNRFDYNTQIITPTKKGDLGTHTLNKLIQEKYNPEDKGKNEKKFGQIIYRVGDKVMQTKNNYDIEWSKENNFKREFGLGIFNGEMGIIEDIDLYNSQLQIRFEDGKTAIYEYSDLEQIEHCFAITVHKSQGSEFDSVLMPILNASPMLLTRNVLYTGMTRAKNKLIIIGNGKTVEFMINNINSKKRNSGLQYKLENIFN